MALSFPSKTPVPAMGSAALPNVVQGNRPPPEPIVAGVRRWMGELTDPVFLGSMIGAQWGFGLSRLGLARLLPRGLSPVKALIGANLGAFGLEGLTFVGAQRGLSQLMGRPAAAASNFFQELGHTYLTLGLLKGLGGVAGLGVRSRYGHVLPTQLALADRLLCAAAPQLAAFTGIYLSHTLAPHLGLAAPLEPMDRLLQSAVTLLQFGAAGSLLNRLPGYARANHRIGQQTQRAFAARLETLPDPLGYAGRPIPALSIPARESPGLQEALQNAVFMKARKSKISSTVPPQSAQAKNIGAAERTEGIQLPEKSNSKSFLALLRHLKERHPETLGHIKLPEPKALVKQYPDLIAQVELARVNSPERVAIARTANDWVLERFKFIHPGGRTTTLRDAVAEYFAEPESPVPLQEVLPPQASSGFPGYRAVIRHKGRLLDTKDKIIQWTQDQLNEGKISPSMARKIRWSTEEAYSEWARAQGRYGYFRLTPGGETPRNVVLISGGAELAPLKFFTEAGARVLVVDRFPLGKKADGIQAARGGLYQFQGDLLTQTTQILGAIRTFAGEGKVDLGFYPYADGLVWLLGAAASALTFGTGIKKLGSVFTLRSPSVVAEVPEETARISEATWFTRKKFPLGWLYSKNLAGDPSQRQVARSIVPDQKLPYAVGNWLGKTLMVEAAIGDGRVGFAPVGPISWTGSMRANKLIVYGLKGAHLFNVDIAEPETSRDIQAFVFNHDYKNLPKDDGRILDPIQEAVAATGDHADFGIFALGSAMHSLVYPAGIAGMLGADGRRQNKPRP